MRLSARDYVCASYLCENFRWVGCRDDLCPEHCQEKEKEKKE